MREINPIREYDLMMTRRQLFGRAALGMGTAAMANLLGNDMLAAETAGQGGLHHPAKAKTVIYLFMSGGPAQMELFDHKPELAKRHGKELPASVRNKQRLTGRQIYPTAAISRHYKVAINLQRI